MSVDKLLQTNDLDIRSLGRRANAKGESSLAFGTLATADFGGVAIGILASATDGVAIGAGSSASPGGIALGGGTTAGPNELTLGVLPPSAQVVAQSHFMRVRIGDTVWRILMAEDTE